MTQLMKKTKEDGLSLRRTFAIMLVLSLCITAILLLTTFQTIKAFHSLSDATDTYIDLQDAADSLMKASDYLTDEVQRYTVLGDRRHLENYFTEAESTRRRELAIEALESRVPDSEALQALKNAMKESVSLMDREYYGMMLMLSALGDDDIPEAMRDIVLSSEDMALTPDAKMQLAREIMHDDGYYEQKDMIRANLSQCIEELKSETHGTQDSMETHMHRDLVWMTILIAIQSLAIIMLLWVTTSLGINPLIQAVEHIKRDQKLPITGAHEFRYLAGTYNTMYTVYKKSIDSLSFKASHDELTGVYNRSGYDLIRQSVDLGTTAFLLFDADKFKRVNDEHGHEIGDRMLQKIARVLQGNFRSDDYICRIGGDEFMVLMVHISKEVRHLIENKVIQINQDLANTEDGLPPMSVSVGVALCRDTANPQELFHDADIALYYVKDHGRNGVCFYEPEMREKPEGRD